VMSIAVEHGRFQLTANQIREASLCIFIHRVKIVRQFLSGGNS